uniref:hypothetical protein n=1 Tax=Nocardia sp. TaxID=1821 RepID=UPI0025908776
MPLTDSRGQGVPYPILSDRPNARAFGENLVEGLADRLVMRFGSASIRNATLTQPAEGMVAY